MTLESLLRAVFPYRAHLEQEVEYLRGQISQHRRRLDELEGALVELARDTRKKEAPRAPAPPLPKVQGKGWDAYRSQHKVIDAEEGEAS